jgi:hypothetical protein
VAALSIARCAYNTAGEGWFAPRSGAYYLLWSRCPCDRLAFRIASQSTGPSDPSETAAIQPDYAQTVDATDGEAGKRHLP